MATLAFASLLLAAPAHATFPGSNGKIAFARNIQGQPTIRLVNPDGSGETALTDGSAPAWSADGTKIAFARGGAIWKMDADGSNQVQLTSPPTDYSDVEPAWSPDGSTIVFSRATGCDDIYGFPSVCYDLMLINSDGTNQRVIRQPDGQSLNASEADWSPDGSRIAMTYFGITTIHPDGTGISFRDSIDYTPSWSPGQVWIAGTHPGSGYETWLIAPDGSARHQVATGTGTSVWSPDGTRIVFDKFTSGTGNDIYTMNDAGGDRTRLTFTGGREPAWQPLPPLPTDPGYPRPKGATPFQAYFTIAYNQCFSPKKQHGAPLAVDSCSPPQQSSDYLTVGTLDANGQSAKSVGSLRLDVVPDKPATPADDTDVKMATSIKDVRCRVAISPCTAAELSDYTGSVLVTMHLQSTDRYNGGSGTNPATTQDIDDQFRLPFRMTVPCSATSDDTIGSLCALSTTVNSIAPGAARGGARANWQLGQIHVWDGGDDGNPATDGNTLFMDEGIFVP